MSGLGCADDRGSVSPFVAVVALALVMVAGMAYDGGQIISAHAEARDVATGAARAAAQEVDLDTLRSNGEIVLDADAAQEAARSHMAEAGHIGDVSVDADRVTVSVTVRQTMRILPLADRTIVATDTATAVDSNSG